MTNPETNRKFDIRIKQRLPVPSGQLGSAVVVGSCCHDAGVRPGAASLDKDDFPNDRFDNAVSLARQNEIQNGSSNQAFELWYVLHFQFLQTAIRRDAYFQFLQKYWDSNTKRIAIRWLWHKIVL